MENEKMANHMDELNETFERIQSEIERLKNAQKQYVIENGDYKTYENHYYVLAEKINNLEKKLDALDNKIYEVQNTK